MVKYFTHAAAQKFSYKSKFFQELGQKALKNYEILCILVVKDFLVHQIRSMVEKVLIISAVKCQTIY